MRFAFRRRLRHPFYPALRLAPAARATKDCPALYGAFQELALAAERGIRAGRAVLPVRRATSPFLPDRQRDALWRMFQVPIYGLLLDGSGNLVGYECEAQDGIHLGDAYAAGLLFGRVESALCECGRPGPRLMPDCVDAAHTFDGNPHFGWQGQPAIG